MGLRIPRPDDGAFRRAIGVPGDAKLIGKIGRLSPEKGQADLLTAARSIVPGHPDARFVFVGVGPDQGRLQSLARDYGIVDDDLGRVRHRRQFIHRVEQDVLKDRPQTSGTCFARHGLVRDCTQRIVAELKLGAFHLKQLAILFGQRIVHAVQSKHHTFLNTTTGKGLASPNHPNQKTNRPGKQRQNTG